MEGASRRSRREKGRSPIPFNFTGSPCSQFKHVFEIGWDQLLVFCTTLAATLAIDLLIGVGAGIFVKLMLQILRGLPVSSLFSADLVLNKQKEKICLVLRKGANFTNYLGLHKQLLALPGGKTLVLDVSEAEYIDHTVMEKLHHFAEDYERSGGKFEIRGVEHLSPSAPHALASRRKILLGLRKRLEKASSDSSGSQGNQKTGSA